ETPELIHKLMETVIKPVDAALQMRGTPFKGVLFVGLMMTSEGPKVIEFNVRFGDPETQSLMRRLDSDLVDLLFKAATGKLDEMPPGKLSKDTAMCVVMAAKGYPGSYKKGTDIKNIDQANTLPNVFVF